MRRTYEVTLSIEVRECNFIGWCRFYI